MKRGFELRSVAVEGAEFDLAGGVGGEDLVEAKDFLIVAELSDG